MFAPETESWDIVRRWLRSAMPAVYPVEAGSRRHVRAHVRSTPAPARAGRYDFGPVGHTQSLP